MLRKKEGEKERKRENKLGDFNEWEKNGKRSKETNSPLVRHSVLSSQLTLGQFKLANQASIRARNSPLTGTADNGEGRENPEGTHAEVKRNMPTHATQIPTPSFT